MGNLALEIMGILGALGNNVTVRPGYVTATTLKPGYLRTAQKPHSSHELTWYELTWVRLDQTPAG